MAGNTGRTPEPLLENRKNGHFFSNFIAAVQYFNIKPIDLTSCTISVRSARPSKYKKI